MPHQVGAFEIDVLASDRIEVRITRGLCVDDDALTAREFYDKIWAMQATLVVTGALLGEEVTVLDHPGQFDHPAQLHLAPAAAHFRSTERCDEIPGFGTKLV